jgi:hypothetical protein
MAAIEPLEKETLQSSPIADSTEIRQNSEEERIPVKDEGGDDNDNGGAELEQSRTQASTVEYSVFSKNMKRYIVATASFAGFFSPLSSQIYFPALNTLATDLHVSISLINLTLTSYMVRSDSDSHSD